jgi:hypothetical protein
VGEHETHAGEPRNPEVAWEHSDVRAGAILKFGVYLLLTTIAVLFLMFKLYQRFAGYEASLQPPPPIMQTDLERKAPLPRLQEKPTLDITELRNSEKAMLGSYGWVDKEKGVVRIPIEEAMSLVADRGLPVRAAGTPLTAGSPAPKAAGKKK